MLTDLEKYLAKKLLEKKGNNKYSELEDSIEKFDAKQAYDVYKVKISIFKKEALKVYIFVLGIVIMSYTASTSIGFAWLKS